jgi:transposase-like protein
MTKREHQHFPPEVKLEVIRRYAAGERPGELAKAYAIRDTLLHQWVGIYRQQGEAGLRRGPGRPNRAEVAARLAGQDPPPEEPAPDHPAAARRRIALLEKKVAQQVLELDFFKHALQHFETSPPPVSSGGATAPAPSSRHVRSGKAD